MMAAPGPTSGGNGGQGYDEIVAGSGAGGDATAGFGSTYDPGLDFTKVDTTKLSQEDQGTIAQIEKQRKDIEAMPPGRPNSVELAESGQLYRLDGEGKRHALPMVADRNAVDLAANPDAHLPVLLASNPDVSDYTFSPKAGQVFSGGNEVPADRLDGISAPPPLTVSNGAAGSSEANANVAEARRVAAVDRQQQANEERAARYAYQAAALSKPEAAESNSYQSLTHTTSGGEVRARSITQGNVEGTPIASVAEYKAPVVNAGGNVLSKEVDDVKISHAPTGDVQFTNVKPITAFHGGNVQMAKVAAPEIRHGNVEHVQALPEKPVQVASIQGHFQAPVDYARGAETRSAAHIEGTALTSTTKHVVAPVKPVPHNTVQHGTTRLMARNVAPAVDMSPLPPPLTVAVTNSASAIDHSSTPNYKQHARTVQDMTSMAYMPPMPPTASVSDEPVRSHIPMSINPHSVARVSAPELAEGTFAPMPTSVAVNEPVRVVNRLADVAVFASHARTALGKDEAPITSWLNDNNSQAHNALELARSAAPVPHMPESLKSDAQMDEIATHFENTITNLTNSGASYDVVQSVVDNYRDFLRYRNSQAHTQRQAAAVPEVPNWTSMNV